MKRKLEPRQEIVKLDVGGIHFKTTLQTLRQTNHFPNQLFAILFATEDWKLHCEEEYYYIDYDPELFRHLLNLLRMPHLVHLTPVNINREVWQLCMEQWGFNESVLEQRLSRQIYKETPLKVLCQQIRHQIRENEETVLKLILQESGYYDSENKSRHIQIYIPVDHYTLPWKEDIGHYLQNPTNKNSLIQLIHESLQPLKADINSVKSNAKPHNYQFSSVDYCTTEGKHMLLDIDFSSKNL
jgi:hypothetical protein